jgi:trk system potassium uptake protein TrkH
MQNNALFRILGLIIIIFSASMLPSLGVNFIYADGSYLPFVVSFIITLAAGFLLWFPFRNSHQELKIRDGFLIVVLIWTVLSLFGALPFLLARIPGITFTNAIFETVSGLTTTGANVFHHLQQMPHDILYYRQQLHLLGGMGIIVLAVAILPMLGVGGMQLYRAETPGPIKDSKLYPRITETAKTLWYIYLGLIALCTLFYWLAGMNFFDALGESYSTISTGGFSLHDNSFGFYHSLTIDTIASIFMLLSAANFGLHFAFLQKCSLNTYWKDPEFKLFIAIVAIVTTITMIVLSIHHVFATPGATFIHALLGATSLQTTTGFTDSNFADWPSFLPFLIMLTPIIGGCAASTAGGMKVIRFSLIFKQAKRELTCLLHPKAIVNIKFGQQTLSTQIIYSMWGFIAVYFTLYVALLLMLLATGLDFTTAFGTLSSCMTNAGAGIGKIATSYDILNPTSKWLMIFAMLAGRLEFLTIFVLFTPAFWRK